MRRIFLMTNEQFTFFSLFIDLNYCNYENNFLPKPDFWIRSDLCKFCAVYMFYKQIQTKHNIVISIPHNVDVNRPIMFFKLLKCTRMPWCLYEELKQHKNCK